MLKGIINFKLGGGRARWLVPGIAIGLLSFLSIAAVFPFGFGRVDEVHAKEMTLAAVLTPSVTLSMSSNVSENVEPTVNGSFKNIATVVRVQVANSEYYSVSISGNPDMVGVANTNAKIMAISGERTQANFVANTWGYSISKNASNIKTAVAATSSTVYKPVPSISTQVLGRQATTNNAADDYYSLNFGAKVDTSIPADTYASRVTLSVTASPIIATEYSLTYNANGATGTAPTKQVASSYEKNYEFTVVSGSGSLTKSGYTFLGWADSANANTAQYTAGSKITVNEGSPNKTVYAVWKQNTSYSITYNGNGNTGGTVPTKQTVSNINTSQAFTVPSGTPTKTGYEFLGWSESGTATSATYTTGSKITLTTAKPTMTLYAVWKKSGLLGISTMQSLTTTACKSASVGDTVQLADERASTNKDSSSINKYWVTKLKDGNCWMTQNLDYAPTTPSSTSSVGKNTTDTGIIWDDGLKVMTNPTTFSTSNAKTNVTGMTASTDKNMTTSISGDIYNAHYLTGNYYQYSAAQIACSSIGSQWELPTAAQAVTVNGSFNKLTSGISQSQIVASPYFFTTTGSASPYDGIMAYVGSTGYYWSSTVDTYVRLLSFSSGGLDSLGWNNRYPGFSVRCYVNGN